MSGSSRSLFVVVLALGSGLVLSCSRGVEDQPSTVKAGQQAPAPGAGASEAARGWVVSHGKPNTGSLASAFPTRIWLRNGANVASNQSQVATLGEPGIRLIQVSVPVPDGFVESLVASGLVVLDYIPDGGYTVYDPGQLLPNAAANSTMDYARDWVASDRVDVSLDLTDTEQDVAVQVVDYPGNAATQALITGHAVASYAGVSRVKNALVYRVRLPVETISELQQRPDVYWIEPYFLPQLNDERQGVIMTGSLSTNATPTGPGYQSWLTANGLTPAKLARFKVDVTDTGGDSGTVPVNHVDLVAAITSITNYTTESGGFDFRGHGTINLAIIGGLPPDANAPAALDTASYLYGLGIAPGVHLGSTRVFDSAGTWSTPGVTQTQMVAAARSGGALITSNSWGSNVNGAYTVDSQEYDALVRDADNNASNGLQPITIFFSAGNAGSAATTIGAPATGKNVIAVGASENYRMTGTDGSAVDNTGADNARDLISFSSRGPTTDGRRKPDIVAPGTHIQGASTTYPGASGAGVSNQYWPGGQTRYAWSSGTSHSCPAAAGMGALVHSWYLDRFAAAPSPAMVKAILAGHSTDMAGGNNGAGGVLGNIPDLSQGWGRLDMSRVFTPTGRVVSDQTTILGSNGDTFTSPALSIVDQSQRVKVVLAWTDAPGATTGHAYNNDLDLLVTVGATQYRGNVFAGGVSTTGGSFDRVNNLEAVHFDPAGATTFSVQVIANNLSADGVPGNADLTDQDFALYIYNAEERRSCTTAQDCNDGNPCTNEICDTDHKCTYSAKCTGSNACNTATCDGTTGQCSTTPVNCSDGNDCTTDTCSLSTGCAHANVADCTSCNGGAAQCLAGRCGEVVIGGSNDFETGTFGYGYSTPTLPAWTIVNTGAHGGTYAAASGLGAGDVKDSQFADMTTTVDLAIAGSVSFWYKVSTQASFDHLYFFADGAARLSASGSGTWATYSYNLTAGTHTLVWRYQKDGSISSGSDAVWVDDIVVTGGISACTSAECQHTMFNGASCTTCSLPNGTSCSNGTCQGGTCSSAVCGDGIVGSGEQCDLGAANGAANSCCSATCTFVAAGTTCRAAAGTCDVAETCTGSTATCPADTLKVAGTTCRAAAGVCDVAETCTGSAAACPTDTLMAAGTICRAAAGVCDVAEVCTGSAAACPADTLMAAGTVCRAAAGTCDVAEVCTGSASACPADTLMAAGTTCRAAAGTCDVAEVCTGGAAACPADTLKSAGTTCRAAAGDCDVAEVCTGSAATCPADTLKSAGTVCRPAVGACDVAETCTGSAATCPPDVTHCTGGGDAGVDGGSDGAVDAGACHCTGTGPGGAPVTVNCGQTACGSDYFSYSCSASGWSWTGQACSGNSDAGSGNCQCSGTGPGGFPVTVNCGQSACGSDFTTYSCSSSGWSGTGQTCTCSCSGTGPGGVPVTVYCGQSACGSDLTTYSCSASGWSWTGQACGGNRDAGTGTCQCSGTGPGGVPVTVNCGQAACGSDYINYSCSASGWSRTGQACSVNADAGAAVDAGVCQCSGTGPGGVPVTVNCGQTACGSDYTNYSCSASGWSWTGQACGVASVPRLLAPLSTATVSSRRPTLRWVLAMDTDGARIDICRDRACSDVVTTFDATGTSARPSVDLPARVLFWRARSRSGGAVGATSTPVWQFAVQAGTSSTDSSWGTTFDANGDGYADAVIGAREGPNRFRGRTFVHMGSPTGMSATASVVLAGADQDDATFGAAVASAGDTNGDGYADLVVGAPAAGNVPGEAVYVYLGGASGLSTSPSVVLHGPGMGSYYGMYLSSAGDVDGDGYADIIVSAHGLDDFHGRSFLHRGSPSGPLPTPSVVIVRPDTPSGNCTLSAVSGGGDLNGDGYGDVVVACPAAGFPGQVYVYLGGPSGLHTTPDVTLTEPNGVGGSYFGNSVAIVGDVNGDGFADILVGAPDFGGTGAKALLYLGGQSGVQTLPSFTITRPATANGWFGAAVAGGGDVNGDGYSDVVIGSATMDGQGAPIPGGGAFVYLGSAAGLASAPWASLMSGVDGTNGFFGSVVANAGDINGDGYTDFLVGAYALNVQAGAAYLYLGAATGVSSVPATSVYGPTQSYQLGCSVY